MAVKGKWLSCFLIMQANAYHFIHMSNTDKTLKEKGKEQYLTLKCLGELKIKMNIR